MSYLMGHYPSYGRGGNSVIKRNYQNIQQSNSRPAISSIRKDPKLYGGGSDHGSMLKSVNPNRNDIYSNKYDDNKYMGSSIKQYKEDKYGLADSRNANSNFRISDPKKSDTFLRGMREDEEKSYKYPYNGESSNYKKQDYTYPKKTQDYRIRVEKEPIYSDKPVGLVGLNNIGNTCFMNSTLQCLFNLPEFNDYFLQEKHLKQARSSSRVAIAYGKLIKNMRTTHYKSETPSELKSAVASKKPRFQGYAQQDAQQFLTGILELISLQLNRSTKPKYKQLTADTSKHTLDQISEQWWNYNIQREDSIVTDYFTGQLLSRVVCSKCNKESIAFDNTWDFALNFNRYDDGDILSMIQNFLKEQDISSDYYCAKCKTFRECRRKLDFYRLPKILVFQLKRFSYGKYRKLKLNNRVKVKTTLDLSSVISQSRHSSVKNPVYDLVGIVNHSGDIDYGHYTAECKNPGNKKWYTFNDSSVHEGKDKTSFESSNPYLLFYAKKEIA